MALRKYEIEWLIDSHSNIILGRPMFYIPKHGNLLPEAFINSLDAKGSGVGLDLEDILTVEQCTKGQIEDWVPEYIRSHVLSMEQNLDTIFWKLYACFHPLTRGVLTRIQAFRCQV